MNIFSDQTIMARRQRLTAAFNDILSSNESVIVYSGDPIHKPGGLDQQYPFLSHPIYYWLTGHRRHGGAVMFAKDLGWVDYVNPISQSERIWEGADEKSVDVSSSSFFSRKNISELPKDRSQFQEVYLFGQLNFNDSNLVKVTSTAQQNKDREKQNLLKRKMDEVRRVKDHEEIQLIQRAASIARFGYDELRRIVKPGLTERDLQIAYESTVLKHGSEKLPYETIVGSGKNAAVLHAIPTSKVIAEDDLILIDAGVDLADYCVDITRVFAASGKVSPRQKSMIEIVQTAQTNSINACTAGAHWKDIHRISASTIAEGLKSLNILKGNVEDILNSGAISVFFPHGVGHMVGLRVRDVGFEENTEPQKHCGVILRVDMPIQENHILTVEPGCYFISALLNNTELKTKYNEFINWHETAKWMDFGGVRIEDDILITDSKPINLTDVVSR
ncbi:MAG: aminopeptidase P N-terminal domain-containing protein [Pseudobdellovibrionaceae bacterium]